MSILKVHDFNRWLSIGLLKALCTAPHLGTLTRVPPADMRRPPPRRHAKCADLSDVELCQAILDYDETAVTHLLVERCGARLGYLECAFHCEGLLGAVYLHLWEDDWRRLRTWTGEASLSTWVGRVALRICWRLVKDRGRFVPLENVRLLSEMSDSVERSIDWNFLLDCIERLPARYRYVIIQCDVLERRCPEVARELETSVQNVYTWRHRARALLRRCLDG